MISLYIRSFSSCSFFAFCFALYKAIPPPTTRIPPTITPTPGNNAPTQTTPSVDTNELMTAFEALTKVVKQQIEKLKDVSDSNVYPLSLNKIYQANKYYKLTKMMNLTRVTLSREILDDIIKTIK